MLALRKTRAFSSSVPVSCAPAQQRAQADGSAFGALARLGVTSLVALRAARRGSAPTLGGNMKTLLVRFFAWYCLSVIACVVFTKYGLSRYGSVHPMEWSEALANLPYYLIGSVFVSA